MTTWTRKGEMAEIRERPGGWEAWNRTRGQLAVLADGEGYSSLEELEAALKADGWQPESKA